MTSLDPRALRNAFGTFMTGVTVVTSHDRDGVPLGFTANSFTSVSIDPPLVLVCLANTSQNYDALAAADAFAINVLAEDQIEISNTFASRVADRFAGIEWARGPNGSPILAGVSGWFDCQMNKTVEAGDHLILIGQVVGFDSSTKPGLGYARGAYVTSATAADALANSTNLIVSALIERNGQVLLVNDGQGGLALPDMAVQGQGASAAVDKLIAATGLQAQPGFIYSVFEDVHRRRQHISFLCQAADGDPALGTFVSLDNITLGAVSDPATRTMLERFAAESALGNFGIYFGDETSGEVRPISHRR